MFAAELVKLKRSSLWIVAIILPVLAITTGTMNYQNNSGALDGGWASFTSQVVLFYGLLFFSIGIGLLTATVWRVEHRGTNWNLLLTTTRRTVPLAAAKIGAIALAVIVMQLILVAGTFISGTFLLSLDGPFPWQFAVIGLLTIVAALPLIAVQSLLSMLLKSFAVPVAICLIGCVVGVASVTSTALQPVGYILPQAIITRAMNLGSTAISGSGELTLSDLLPIIITSLTLTSLVMVLTVGAIRIIKLR